VRRAISAPPIIALVLLAGGCGGRQSTLRTDSPASEKIDHLWWIMFVGSAIVFGVVTVLVLGAVLKSRGSDAPSTDDRRAKRLVLIGGAIVPLGVLVGLFVLILQTLPATAQPRRGSAALEIDVVGHKWFWEVRYPAQHVVTANEIHIPAGERVGVTVTTDDVIHSFWVPGLNRKMDMIPGRENRVLLEARRPGVYRGQCAEFCGLQHAKMAFLVFADPPARFRRWLANEERPARATGSAGQRVFLSSACAGCHTIRGTRAQGKVGPDLTHLASRTTLAAASIPNDPGDLAGWILDPQHVKPGNKMPGLDLRARLQPLLQYLEALK
jgi:cytochrome c oxidase subunit II